MTAGTPAPGAAGEASAADRSPLLEVRQLDAGYGDVQILWDLSLDIFEGEVVALIGANGAGKTTLLCTISQLIRPRAGTIRFAGRDITAAGSEAVVRAGIVHVPQGRRLFAGLTVKDNLLQGAYLRTSGGPGPGSFRDPRAIDNPGTRRSRAGAEIKRSLDEVFTIFPRLAERSGQLAGLLSGGEQQMCAIARGLMSKPRLLMIDELSLGLAPLIVDTLIALVSELNGRGMTILLVEQDVQVALEHAHRGYVLETGRIIQASPARELLVDPRIRQAYLGM